MGLGEKIAAGIAFPMVAASASKKRKKYVQSRTRLYDGNLRVGDILIAQELGGAMNSAIDANFVRGGQALFSHFGRKTTASSTSEHVTMIIKDGTQHNVEAVSIGVTTSQWLTARKYLVYRYIGPLWELRREAVKVAQLLSVDSLALESGDQVVKYASLPKMAASVFRRKSAGRFTSKRIERLVNLCDELESGSKTAADVRKEGLGMICSELIVTCYEVAAYRLTGKGVMNVDPRAMTSKALEAHLSRSGHFALQGVFVGQVSQDIDVRGQHEAIAEIIMREVAAGNAAIENNLEIDKEEMTVHAICELRDSFKLTHTLNELNSHRWKYDATVQYFPVGTNSLIWSEYKAVYTQQGFEVTSSVRSPKSNMAVLSDNS